MITVSIESIEHMDDYKINKITNQLLIYRVENLSYLYFYTYSYTTTVQCVTYICTIIKNKAASVVYTIVSSCELCPNILCRLLRKLTGST